MNNKSNKTKLTSFSDHLDSQYGKSGNVERELFEEEFESFKLGVMNNLRKSAGLRKHIFQELKTMQVTSAFRL
jgi:HTH-type transcriptional regulator/antitoxin HipB